MGELEDVKFSGDSAETALVASDDNLDEVFMSRINFCILY